MLGPPDEEAEAMIKPFEIAVPAETMAELRKRLAATRWPYGVTEDGGMPLGEMRELVRYWQEEFDWDARQRELNRLPHFQAHIDGQQIHFLHQRAADAGAPPLLLLHGWPGSFVEMLAVLPLLARSFDVVVPSLPGYGFSAPAAAAGMSNARMAELMAQLMAALGYERFGAQGGDWGAGIASWLAAKFPNRLLGIHLNYIPGSYAPAPDPPPSAAEQEFLADRAAWLEASGAYGHVQRTRPLTLAYGLSDSPAGLAAWILEKFREWADPASRLPLDTLLTNVTLYWVTNSIAPSVRLYLESVQTPLRFAAGERIAVPCGIARFPYEAPFPPRSWVDRVYDVRRWTEMPRGGHFAALEAPELLAADVAAFFADVTEGGVNRPTR
jgi:pimeloyl-ACP methyl ester carboxylesterase